MIGHYLLMLTPAQEDAILVTRLICGAGHGEEPGTGDYWKGNRACLVGAVVGRKSERPNRGHTAWYPPMAPHFDLEQRYDELVRRFSARRVAAAIRSRILANRARRILPHPVESVVV